MNPFQEVKLFESKIADWFGAPYGVAVDCCTHGLELCLRYTNADLIEVPTHTYLSIPMLADKLNIGRVWKEEEWIDSYNITPDIIDAAVLWRQNSYQSGTFMVISFQFKKHLSLGRGGMILTDNIDSVDKLKAMSYDGRHNNNPWAEQDIYSIGYHYYMTPETARLGIDKLNTAISTKPKEWSYLDYPNLTNLTVFQNG